jgi:hypothetical protein
MKGNPVAAQRPNYSAKTRREYCEIAGPTPQGKVRGQRQAKVGLIPFKLQAWRPCEDLASAGSRVFATDTGQPPRVQSGGRSLPLLYFSQFLPEGRQAGDRRAVGLVGGRLFLYLCPSLVGILFIPGTPGLCIKRSLRDQTIERATIISQVEDAIALMEIEISAVQFAAMR